MRLLKSLVVLAAFVVILAGGVPAVRPALATQATISGVIWQDENADGTRQPQERGMALAEVRLTGPSGDLPPTRTDSGGHYSFSGLSPGNYQLSLGPITAGMWAQTAPRREVNPPVPVSLTLGSDSANTVDFGLFPLGGVPRFVGSAWINAEPIAEPEVRAFVGSMDCTLPSSLVLAIDPAPVSRFEIRVAPAAFVPGCGIDGSTITFILNGQRANETAVWRSAPIEQLPPGTIATIPPPPAIAPPVANTQNIALTVGAPFAAYSGSVTDASTGQRLDVQSPPRFPRVDAYVADTLCGSVPGYGLGAYVVVPSEQLNPGCGRDGAVVRFYVDGALAPEQTAWKPGVQNQTLTLSSADIPAAVFRIVISADSLNSLLNRTATGFDTLGQALGTLTVLGDGKPCTQVDVSAPQSDIFVDLGRPSQPAECTHEGATITFVDGRGIELTTRMTLTKGTQQRLSNLAPVPPGGATSGAPSSRSRPTISPPDTGDAGLAVQ